MINWTRPCDLEHWLYNCRIFCSEYNLSFFHLKKDQCLTCTKYQEATPEVKIGLEGEYKEHLQVKDQSQEAKAANKESQKW